MELSVVIYFSVGIIFIGTLLFGLFFYTISRKAKYANNNTPYKIRIFEDRFDETHSIPPSRHLRKRKFYRTNFADTIEIKRKKKPEQKKSNKRIITAPYKLNLNKRFTILNANEIYNPTKNSFDKTTADFNFRTTFDKNQK